MARTPKEDGEGLKSVLKTIRDWYAARDTGAGRLAMAAILPQVAIKRCIRHQLQAVRRRRGPGEVRGKHGVLHFAHCQSFSFRSPLAVRAPEARVRGCGLGGIRLRTCPRRGPKTGPPDKISSKTSSLFSLGFPGQFLSQCRGGSCSYYPLFRLRPSETVSVTPKPGSCYSPRPRFGGWEKAIGLGFLAQVTVDSGGVARVEDRGGF